MMIPVHSQKRKRVDESQQITLGPGAERELEQTKTKNNKRRNQTDARWHKAALWA
ncbi:hypothetical protein JOB18_035509 [Solea senegalensis]|uniref:Uncharacterized protein n=1 Tax=Solea senegalensis TaxID=28829 RepID=A0AAV6RJJ8_SOLSE|nr:hypothetical protein JOB18_035509 [Solea senegalensis]